VKTPEDEIKELYEEIYAEEPPIGSWVIVKHYYNETIITGEVVALKHTQPQRGWREEADFEFVVWTNFKFRIAGVKTWLDGGDWEILNVMTEFESKKLEKKERKQ
jgi:hypothetical protein